MDTDNETNKEPKIATHLAPPFPKVDFLKSGKVDDYNFGNSNCIKKL
jgi:hypothetical protein